MVQLNSRMADFFASFGLGSWVAETFRDSPIVQVAEGWERWSGSWLWRWATLLAWERVPSKVRTSMKLLEQAKCTAKYRS